MHKSTPLIFLLVVCSVTAFGQWTDVLNNNINFEVLVTESRYSGDNDFDGNADPAVGTYIEIVNANLEYSECVTWDCEAPCTYTNYNDLDGISAEDLPFDSKIYAELYAHESDATNVNECDYHVGDDHNFASAATFRDGSEEILVVYPNVNFYPCAWNQWLGDGSSLLYPNSSIWDQKMKTIWRYTHGDDISDPLDFGTLADQNAVSDVNSNRELIYTPTVAVQYNSLDNSVNISPDIYYSFTLSANANVTISTGNPHTNFDTYLKLFTEQGAFLVLNDDYGTGTSSLINEDLCAGTYIFLVEGFGINEGVFEVSVEAEYYASTQPTVTPTVYNTSCEDATDGSVYWTIGGGLPPYSNFWESDPVGQSNQTGLGVGQYVASVEDACGVLSAAFVSVENGDDQNPTANCVSSVDVLVSGSGQTQLNPMDVDNGSTDNCGIDVMVVNPALYDINDVGANNATLTVYDDNGNFSECQFTANVQNVTSISETENSEGRLVVYPNPSDGLFNLEVAELSSNDNAILMIVDNLGRTVYSETITSNTNRLDLSELSSGIYSCILQNGETISKTDIAILK